MTQPTVFTRGSWAEVSRITQILRRETIGGALLLVAATLALVWANSPWSESYRAVREFTVGPATLHLDLTLAAWAADGLLAVFFFVVGLELKREFVAGDLRTPSRAVLPIVAAVGGMLAPAVIYVAINLNSDTATLRGWAVPTATDIAFALAVLAVVNTHLPCAMRTFLLTLAVVDDLLAITVIAVFYTSSLELLPLGAALVPLAVFTILVQRHVRSWWLLLPLAALTWGLVHASGIHATVAGVLLGFAVPVRPRRNTLDTGAGTSLAEHFEHRLRPFSAGVAVPVFAFFAAGVTVGGAAGLIDAFSATVTVGIVAGLLAGKALGILLAVFLLCRFTRATLDPAIRWVDITGLSILAGVGFTVSLLIGELAFGSGSASEDHARIGVLAGSVASATVAAVILRLRNRVYRRIAAEEALDSDHDDIPDVFQASTASSPPHRNHVHRGEPDES